MTAFASAMAVVFSGMRNSHYIIIGVTLLLLSCGNSNGGRNEVPIDGGYGIGIDTATINKNLRTEDSLSIVVSAKEIPSVSSSSSQQELHEPDNLRGFDPASEDDIDDNGMTRYMEVNDEEGWD